MDMLQPINTPITDQHSAVQLYESLWVWPSPIGSCTYWAISTILLKENVIRERRAECGMLILIMVLLYNSLKTMCLFFFPPDCWSPVDIMRLQRQKHLYADGDWKCQVDTLTMDKGYRGQVYLHSTLISLNSLVATII